MCVNQYGPCNQIHPILEVSSWQKPSIFQQTSCFCMYSSSTCLPKGAGKPASNTIRDGGFWLYSSILLLLLLSCPKHEAAVPVAVSKMLQVLAIIPAMVCGVLLVAVQQGSKTSTYSRKEKLCLQQHMCILCSLELLLIGNTHRFQTQSYPTFQHRCGMHLQCRL